jgi:methylated-DNA-[protein]-cysteine S-methyltransferase
MDKTTAFQRAVYAATSSIPRGKVATYGLLARHIGRGSARAVGQALRRNPFAPDVPCHRVVAADLSMGGFGGETEGGKIARKRALLESEGVRIVDGKVADRSFLHQF